MGMGNGTGVQDREWDCNWDVRRRMGQGAWGAERGMELGWGYKPQDGDWDRDRDRDRESGTGGMGWVGMWDGELDWDWDVRCEIGNGTGTGTLGFTFKLTIPAGYICQCAPIIHTGTVCVGRGVVSGNQTHGIPVQVPT